MGKTRHRCGPKRFEHGGPFAPIFRKTQYVEWCLVPKKPFDATFALIRGAVDYQKDGDTCRED
jgi:hypothetical protein